VFFQKLPEVGVELDEVGIGKKPAREKIMFMDLGVGLIDIRVADRIY